MNMRNVLIICILTFVLTSCGFSEAQNETSQQAYKDQVAAYNSQLEKTQQLQKLTEEQLVKSKEQQIRMDKLLDRWEQQANRYDAILDKWEKQSK